MMHRDLPPGTSFEWELTPTISTASVNADSPLQERMPLARSPHLSSTSKFPETEDCSEVEGGRLRVRRKRLLCVEEQGVRCGGCVDSDANEQPVSLLTDRTDLVLEVLVYLDEAELLMAMGVCRRWRELAGARQLWQEKGELRARDGSVNWPAFKNKGKIRQKRHSMVSFRFGPLSFSGALSFDLSALAKLPAFIGIRVWVLVFHLGMPEREHPPVLRVV